MLHYFTFTTILEILCFVIAFFFLSKDSIPVWKYFSIFLLITWLSELAGVYLKRNHHPHNAWVYNILMVFEMAFVNLMYLEITNRYFKVKGIVAGGFILFVLLYMFELLTHGFFVYNNLSYTVMSVILVIYALIYYFGLMKADDYSQIAYLADFWWVTGALFYYFGETACDLFYYKLQTIYITPEHSLDFYIYAVLNVLLYGCWSYSFICRKWQEQKRKLEIQ